MGISKVVYGGDTLIDLTSDTVEAEALLVGHTAHGKDGELIEGTCSFDSNTTDATAKVSEILTGKTAYVGGTKITGSMANNGSVTGTISTVAGSYTIPVGFHDGSGRVSINADDQAKLIAQNIREGITILGVEGAMSGSEDFKPQTKTVTPSASKQTITPDAGYNALSQVIVLAIPYQETENPAGGKTVTIAGTGA